MFSKQRLTAEQRAIRLAVLFVTAGAVSWISVSGETLGKVFSAPARDMDRAPVHARPDILNNAPIRLWGEDISADAVDANGVENDLDGNASALIAPSIP
jgi:hypothetical protein